MLVGLQNVAFAAVSQETASLQVSANVQNSCTLNIQPVSFGTIVTPTVDTYATGAVIYTCSNGLQGHIGLDRGINGQDVNSRALSMPNDRGGASSIIYALYRDSTHNDNWGNTPGSDAMAFTGNGSAISLPVYGLIFSGQSASTTGNFTDTVTVTMYY